MEACVSDRRTISFLIPRDAAKPTEWLRSDATWTADKGQALRLTLHARPTPMERPRIRAVSAEAAGGVDKLLEQQQQQRVLSELVRQEVLREIVSTFWPDGRPEVEDEERAAQEALIETAWGQTWMAHRSPTVTQLIEVSTTLSLIDFLGTWAALQVDAPLAWRDLGARDDLDLEHLRAIVAAWEAAAEEFAQGNGRASV